MLLLFLLLLSIVLKSADEKSRHTRFNNNLTSDWWAKSFYQYDEEYDERARRLIYVKREQGTCIYRKKNNTTRIHFGINGKSNVKSRQNFYAIHTINIFFWDWIQSRGTIDLYCVYAFYEQIEMIMFIEIINWMCNQRFVVDTRF